MFIATTCSRLTAFAVLITQSDDWAALIVPIVFLPLSLAVPSILLFLTKICALEDLSAVDLVKAVLGEQTTHSLWGGRGREGSRKLHLFMQVYLLVIHSSFMVFMVLNINSGYGHGQEGRLQIGAVVSLSTGWLPGWF